VAAIHRPILTRSGPSSPRLSSSGNTELYNAVTDETLTILPPVARAIEATTNMAAKPTKTAAELADMIMREIRNHPECRNIEKVVITPKKREVAHHRNWNAAWVMGDETTAVPAAWQIATKLQNEFDLTEDGAFSS
jgi:hypothetical protein